MKKSPQVGRFLLFLSVITEHSNDDGCQAHTLAGDTADGQVENVVDQPANGTDRTQSPDIFRTGHVEGNAEREHADDGQNLQKQVGEGGACSEKDKGQRIGQQAQAMEDAYPNATDFLGEILLIKHQRPGDGNDIQ